MTVCRGQVSGPAGAAVKLGLPRQTLTSKITTLGIDVQRFTMRPGHSRPRQRLAGAGRPPAPCAPGVCLL